MRLRPVRKADPLMPARLFIDGLPATTSSEDLLTMLAPFGTVVRIDLKDNAAVLRYASVEMAAETAAAEATRRLNHTRYRGRTISVVMV